MHQLGFDLVLNDRPNGAARPCNSAYEILRNERRGKNGGRKDFIEIASGIESQASKASLRKGVGSLDRCVFAAVIRSRAI